jgi:hypothetical protein
MDTGLAGCILVLLLTVPLPRDLAIQGFTEVVRIEQCQERLVITQGLMRDEFHVGEPRRWEIPLPKRDDK